MSLEEATQAAGVRIVSSQALPAGAGCTYDTEDPAGLVGFEFTDAAYWDRVQALPHSPGTVGDESIVLDEEGLTILAVRTGTTYISVTVLAPAGARPAQDIATTVARLVIARRS
jgi:hypothetical protein